MNRTIFLWILVFSFYNYKALAQDQSNHIIIKYKHIELIPKGDDHDLYIPGSKIIDSISNRYHVIDKRRLRTGKTSGRLVYVLSFPLGTDIKSLISEYLNTGLLEYAESDYQGGMNGSSQGPVVPNDPFFYRQWGLHNDGSFTLSPAKPGADINMENAWTIEQGDSSVIVGVIDSGCKLDHPELVKRIWINHGEIPNNGIDDDQNGYIDDVNGWNFSYDTNNPIDDNGHGTNVTGIIGASANNSIGYAGIDWNCKLMILKGLDSMAYGYYTNWSEALYYAADNGARIVNMSLGGLNSSTTLSDAVAYAIAHNVLVVAAMGNNNNNVPLYPANCTSVMAVGATDSWDDRVVPFPSEPGSNYGSNISVVAPGLHIYGLNYLSDTNYVHSWSGTSQATPHVSGLAALLLAQDTSLLWSEIKFNIEITAQDQVGDPSEDTPGWDQYYGFGRIDAYQALSLNNSIASIQAKLNRSIRTQAICYPNPAKDAVSVLFSENTTQYVTYTIVNILGQIVSSGSMQEQLNVLSTPFAKGMYILNLNSSEGYNESIKVTIE